MSLVRAIGIMLILALSLSVLGTITSSPTATPVQTRPAIVSLPAAAAPANPAPIATTTAASAKPTPVAVTTALAAKPAAMTVTPAPPPAKAAPSAAASSHPTTPAKPASQRADHAALTPHQPVAPQRTAAKSPPAPAQHAVPPAAKYQQRATAADEPRPPKAYVNTRSHWLPPPPPSRDRKDTQTSSVQRDRYASRPDYRETDRRYTLSSRTAPYHDDARDDRRSYSSNARGVAPRAGYRQSQDYGRRDDQTRVSDDKRKALLREYKNIARRQSEIDRELGRNFSSEPASRRDRYSDASGGRQ